MDILSLITEAAKSGHPISFVKDLLLWLVVWRSVKPFMTKEINELKTEMAGQMGRLTKSVDDLADHLKGLESKHDMRFNCLEERVEKIETKSKE